MIKVIACKVFETYIEGLISENMDVTYLEVQLHNTPNKLIKLLQKEIDQSQGYEKIILLYDLCGNTLLEIQARNIPLVVVKVHDCLGMLLGGHKEYLKHFEHRKSSCWTCKGLLDNKGLSNFKDYQQWVIDYGVEEAEYLKSILCLPCDIYVKIDDEDNHPEYKENIQGNRQYLKDILSLQNKDLLTLDKNEKLKLTNDDNVIEKYGIG